MDHAYVVRYGLMSRVGRFAAECEMYERGQTVVVRSARGLELGEVLVKAGAGGESNELDLDAHPESAPRVLRLAGADDLDRARQLASDRPSRLAACEQVFTDGVWPLQLLDVEPLLDGSRTVLHYLGPHRLDASGLLQAFRERCGLDVLLEPAGIDASDEPADEPEAAHGCGSCGSGGGCGSEGGCGSGSHSGAGGCSGCAVKELIKDRR
jgi:cell fate regulator YaaT (PSP1 superfamily)